MIQAFGYLRVSGNGVTGKIDDTDTFPRQREAILSFAAGAGLTIVQWFEERAITGTTEWEDRPEWLAMMLALNGVETIIIERLDRLARDLMVQEHIIADLKKRGITLISTTEPDLCSVDPTRILYRQIMGAVTQYDRSMLVLKLRGSRKRKKAQTGRCEGRKPYGHRPEETAAYHAMLALRAEGRTTEDIADEMNQRGLTTRYGQPWRGSTIAKILRRAKP